MSTSPRETPDYADNIPDILVPYKFNATRITGTGVETSTATLRCPPPNQDFSEESNAIQDAWNYWWRSTPWSQNPAVKDPVWNSNVRTGKVWKQFGESAHIHTGHPYVYCLKCGHILQHPIVKLMGTKHLHNHLGSRVCTETENALFARPHAYIPSTLRGPRTPSTPQYSTHAFQKELVRVVIDNNWSFRSVERQSFHQFLTFLRPEIPLPTRYKFTQMFLEEFKITEKSLLHDLNRSAKISIALDAWSAGNHLSFLAIKGYYINDKWQLKDTLLDFIPLRGRHTGSAMATDLLQTLHSRNIKHRLLAITCDNAGNNGTLTRTLQEKLADQDIFWSPEENTIPCLAHVINLVVQDIIQHLKLSAPPDIENANVLQQRHIREIVAQVSVPNSLRKVCRFITGHYHSLTVYQLRAICIAIDLSPQRYERFLDTQNQLQPKKRLSVIRDVRTRWNSTYDMCERAIKLQPFIDQWLAQEIAMKPAGRTSSSSTATDTVADYRDLKKLQLAAAEWDHLKAITRLLLNFKTATDQLSNNHHPSVQHIWEMYNALFDFLDDMQTSLGDHCNEAEGIEWPAVVEAAAEKGKAKLKKYYSKTWEERGYLFNCATVLDPSQKLTPYEVCLSQSFITGLLLTAVIDMGTAL
jgi:hypothetical protein